MVWPLWKSVWLFLKRLNIELTYDSTVQLMDIYPKELKAETQTVNCTPMFMAALFTVVRG